MNVQDIHRLVDEAYASLKGQPLRDRMEELAEEVRRECGDNSTAYGVMLNELGGFYRGQYLFAESEETLQKALALMEERYGAGDPNVATVINNLAGTFRMSGRYEEAEKAFFRCLDIYASSVGKSNILYAAGLNNLALLYLAQKQTEKAETYLKAASDILAQQPEHLFEYAASLSNLADLYMQQKNYDAAEKSLKEAVRIHETKIGKGGGHYYSALNKLGLVSYYQGRLSQAETYLKQALAACETVYGTEHKEYHMIQDHLTAVRKAVSSKDAV